MSKEDHIEFNGIIEDSLGGGQYKILIESSQNIRARLSGKMKQNHIRVLPGDKVIVEVSPYDLTHGIITRRFK